MIQKKEPNTHIDAIHYAIFSTNYGQFKAKLYTKETPHTAWNFIHLANGEQENDHKEGPYYDGLIFHRVIDNFMIQGGCPLKNGRGGPGYQFEDEFHPELKHDRKGLLSMANAGPATNGSQFFITLVPTPHLDNRHTVFGEIVEGMDIVEKIGKVETDYMDKPVNDIVIESVKIEMA